ncbi:MAG TPA: alanine racemase [Tepidisphaeraceae bacterium]|nr:alanine racemase [Tepidisphaeraceae bacterium]
MNRIRANIEQIRTLVKVPILAVVKADAYGLGASAVACAIAEIVDGFCVFQLQEAIEAKIHQHTGKRTLALGPPASMNPHDFQSAGVTPSVSTVEQAVLLRAAKPALCVDTGMQRLACPIEKIDSVLRAGECCEAFTHGTRVSDAQQLKNACGRYGIPLHAAATSLLHEPQALLDAVRPGLAMYRGAARVVTTLIEAHETIGPAGYTGFTASRHGVILMGYAHGLRPGVCTVNGTQRRVLEVGMQTAFVELGEKDRVGDEVALLDETVNDQVLAEAWCVSPHEVLLDLCATGRRIYSGE